VADTGISLICSRLASRLLLFCLTRFPCGGAARGKTVATTSSIELLGGCHCGNIRVWLRLAQRPSEILLRSCACSFCRMHGTRTVADPGGHFEFQADDWSLVEPYRFGLCTADYFVCRRCGVYVGAVCETVTGLRAVVNVNCLADRAAFTQIPSSRDYDGETTEARLSRRASTWMPATLRR